MGVEYTGSFGSSIKTGGLFYLAVGFESIYPESKRNEIMSRISNLYETQLSTGNKPYLTHPNSISIHKIYPNPTNTSATINLSIPKFENKTTFNNDISGWDGSNVTKIHRMFRGTSNFNQSLNSWDVSSVTNMH